MTRRSVQAGYITGTLMQSRENILAAIRQFITDLVSEGVPLDEARPFVAGILKIDEDAAMVRCDKMAEKIISLGESKPDGQHRHAPAEENDE